MSVSVHRGVGEDLRSIERTDPTSAALLRKAILQLRSGVEGRPVDSGSKRVLTSVPGFGIVIDGVDSGKIRVIGVGRLPTLYDADRLREQARTADMSSAAGRRRVDPTVPSPAPRTRIVTLDAAVGDAIEPTASRHSGR
jgi:hypothetical protein